MRWSIIRLICLRELRDQLRDRRTLFMIAVLPVLLYPLAGFGVMQLAMGFLQEQNTIGIQGAENLPPWSPNCMAFSPARALSWFAVTPPQPGAPLSGLERITSTIAWLEGRWYLPVQDYPPLLVENGDKLRFSTFYLENATENQAFTVRTYDNLVSPAKSPDQGLLDRVDRTPLDERQVDLLIIVPPEFRAELEKNGHPSLFVLTREKDDRSRLVYGRLSKILGRWKKHLKEVRLLRRGLAYDFDEAFEIKDTDANSSPSKRANEDLFNALVRIFPFVLVMWSLAGALYPAVDLCAGEKERGTMETLLISPASREEIVWGKFLTIWIFSAATALLNLLSMGFTTWQYASLLPHDTFQLGPLLWGVALLMPLSAFFSAICLAVGAYARSSKEGQYYLMPLFLITMPLIFLTLAPGVELNPFYSMVPITGVALLLQKLMTTVPDRTLWLYFITVLAPMVLYSWLALGWAIEQFKREEVLFREAERLDIGLWIRHLLREKEILPNTSFALFCFGVILGLQWFSLSLGINMPLLVRAWITQLAFVAAPPLFMTLLLTSWPRQGLALRRPAWWSLPAAVVLAFLMAPPLAELSLLVLQQFPIVKATLDQQGPLTEELRVITTSGLDLWLVRGKYFLVLAILPAFCEELAFRGFILTGLGRRFRPGTAIFLSSFLFAIYPMSVIQFLPYFLLGLVLAVLVIRGNSILPAIAMRLIYNSLLVVPLLFPAMLDGAGFSETTLDGFLGLRLLLSGACVLLAAVLVALIWVFGKLSLGKQMLQPDQVMLSADPLVLVPRPSGEAGELSEPAADHPRPRPRNPEAGLSGVGAGREERSPDTSAPPPC
jgi:sodium transport system permease protein